MRHTPLESVGRCTCHTQWSFHLKCGKDHDGCRQIHGTPKGSFGSHFGLRDPVHIRHYMLDDQRFKFLGDALLAIAHVGPGEPDNLRYTFPIAYWNVKVSRH
jgi:hypothetical protein